MALQYLPSWDVAKLIMMARQDCVDITWEILCSKNSFHCSLKFSFTSHTLICF